MHCVHTAGHGLCDRCQEAFDVDPIAWLEYGDHEEGIRNWQRLQDEIAAWPRPDAVDEILDRLDPSDIPF